MPPAYKVRIKTGLIAWLRLRLAVFFVYLDWPWATNLCASGLIDVVKDE